MKYLHFVFGVLAYFVFFGVFLYLIGFVGDLYVPVSVDRGPAASLSVAIACDIFAIVLFGVQHSVMARPGFKAVLTRSVPPVLERTLYVLMSSIALLAMIVLWRPIAPIVWEARAPWLAGAL
ncbi:hypothetical protein U1839_17210 [Sphingomonas sp. RT2P30]|uniref:hypothetical protein n=1 Tax=Parasphingomonas halimpatiens TaxID=3096162 RepID=UPI002FCB8340